MVGDLEITRKITATETTEVEHKAKTQERIVQGTVVSSFFIFMLYILLSIMLIYICQNLITVSSIFKKMQYNYVQGSFEY